MGNFHRSQNRKTRAEGQRMEDPAYFEAAWRKSLARSGAIIAKKKLERAPASRFGNVGSYGFNRGWIVNETAVQFYATEAQHRCAMVGFFVPREEFVAKFRRALERVDPRMDKSAFEGERGEIALRLALEFALGEEVMS